MATELQGEYYADYLAELNAKMTNPWSIHGQHHAHLNRFVQTSVSTLRDGGDVLDAGCGLSIWVTAELRRRYRVVGVDCQPDSIAACRRIYPGADYRLSDLYELPFPDASFDAVVMREVIEHFQFPDRAVAEVARVLRPKGRFILTTPNYSSPLLFLVENIYNRYFTDFKPYEDDVHPSKFKINSLRKALDGLFVFDSLDTIDLGLNIVAVAARRA